MAPQTAKVQQPDESFLLGANETFIAELYSRYLREPGSVDPEWADYFEGLSDAETAVLADLRGASWSPPTWPGSSRRRTRRPWSPRGAA